MNCIVGIDGGGTKAHLRVAQLDGTTVFDVLGNSTNVCSNSIEQVFYNLDELWEAACKKAGAKLEPLGICLGTAGISNSEAAPFLKDVICKIAKTNNVSIVGDMELPLIANANGVDAALVLSGTGSIAYARKSSGETARVGGYGHIIGDEGSGYYISVRALNAVMQNYDGLAEKTLLTELILNKTGCNSQSDLIGHIYNDNINKNVIASLAICVKEAAEQSDKVALSILKDAAYLLFKMCRGIVQKLGLDENEMKIVLSGSILLKNHFVNEMFKKQVKEAYPNALVNNLENDAVHGAVLIAKNLVAANNNKVR